MKVNVVPQKENQNIEVNGYALNRLVYEQIELKGERLKKEFNLSFNKQHKCIKIKHLESLTNSPHTYYVYITPSDIYNKLYHMTAKEKDNYINKEMYIADLYQPECVSHVCSDIYSSVFNRSNFPTWCAEPTILMHLKDMMLKELLKEFNYLSYTHDVGEAMYITLLRFSISAGDFNVPIELNNLENFKAYLKISHDDEYNVYVNVNTRLDHRIGEFAFNVKMYPGDSKYLAKPVLEMFNHIK